MTFLTMHGCLHGCFHPEAQKVEKGELVSVTDMSIHHGDEVLQERLRQLRRDGGQKQEEEGWWKTKTLHGLDHWQTKEVADIKKSYW